MKRPVILFRRDGDLSTEEEFKVAQLYFPVVERRSQVPENSLVIGRYSVLPYYRELELDLASKNATLVNSSREFGWIAGFDWYDPLRYHTPRSWREYEFHNCPLDGPFILKGATNSRKQQWKTHMYAETRKEALEVASRLANDPLIGPQGIIYRQFVPLKVVEVDPIYGQPWVNEWRFFYYKEKMLSYGHYWTNCSKPEEFSINEAAFSFADGIAEICSEYATFFVLDIAERADGGWILIEVNDGQCSGLSDCSPHELYENLGRMFDED